MSIFGSLLGAGLSFLGSRSRDKSNASAQAAANQQNYAIAEMNNQTIRRNNEAQIRAHYDQLAQQQGNYKDSLRQQNRWNKTQLRFAKSQLSFARRGRYLDRKYALTAIQDRVNDAKKAGLHPLYALGAAGSQPSGLSSGATFIPGQSPSGSVSGTGLALASPQASDVRPVVQQGPMPALAEAFTVASSLNQLSQDRALTSYYESLAQRTAQEANYVRVIPAPEGEFRPLSPGTPLGDPTGGYVRSRTSRGSKVSNRTDPYQQPVHNQQRVRRGSDQLQHGPAAADRTKDWNYMGDEIGQLLNAAEYIKHIFRETTRGPGVKLRVTPRIQKHRKKRTRPRLLRR